MPSDPQTGPLQAAPDAVAVPIVQPGSTFSGGPSPEWQGGLYQRVVDAIHALPGLFNTSLNISGVRATDLFTLNSALGASIEQSVVDNLNALRKIWDPDERFHLYAFVRQSKVFPDVRLQTDAPNADPQVLIGIELKGWFALAKEGEPSFRYKVTPAAYQAPYPNKGQKFNDEAVRDGGGNFGRVARGGVMKEFIAALMQQPVAGIPLGAWQRSLKIFPESVTETTLQDQLWKIETAHATSIQRSSESRAAFSNFAESVKRLILTIQSS